MLTATDVAPQTPNTAPVVDPDTLQFRRAVTDDSQGFSICRRLIKDNTERNKKNAAILQKLNDQQPFSQEKLKAAGQGWRNNRSTGFMSSIVKRVLPPYKQVIDSARVLTSSRLRNEQPDGEQKSKDFQTELTKTVRQWSGWHNFTHLAIEEDLVFGFCPAGWMDEYDWHPTMCRGDDALFPNGSPQEAKDVPLWMWIHFYLIHELADKLFDPEASQSMGWNIDNLVEAINDAQPRKENNYVAGQERRYEDTVREASMGRSYSEGVKVIETYTLIVREPTGKVSQYMYSARSGKVLFQRLDRFESMDECLRLLVAEVGNGKLHGSKGIGRILYNTHVAADQARNMLADNYFLAGLVLIKGSLKGLKEAAITVLHPCAVLHPNFEVVSQQFQVNTDAFEVLDKHLTNVAEVQVGAFMPGQIGNDTDDARTASEVNYVASIEQQIKEGILARFWAQFLGIIFEMQKRIFSQDNILEAVQLHKERHELKVFRYARKMVEFISRLTQIAVGVRPPIQEEKDYLNPEAVYACLNLLEKGLTPEEIYECAQCPPNQYTDDLSMQRTAALANVVAAYGKDPSIRQNVLKQMHIASQLGNTLAEQLLIPEEDQTVVAEAVRMQLLEMNGLMVGEPVPTSPRDMHPIHLQVMMQKLEPLLGSLGPQSVTPQTIALAQNVLTHFDAHIEGAVSQGAKPADLKEQVAISKKAHEMIANLQSSMKALPQNALQFPTGATPAAAVAQSVPPILHDAGPLPPGNPGAPAQQPLPPVPVNPLVEKPFARGPQNVQPIVSPT